MKSQIKSDTKKHEDALKSIRELNDKLRVELKDAKEHAGQTVEIIQTESARSTNTKSHSSKALKGAWGSAVKYGAAGLVGAVVGSMAVQTEYAATFGFQ